VIETTMFWPRPLINSGFTLFFLTPFDVFPVGFPIFFLVYDEGITRIYPSVDSIIWCGSQAERRDLRLRSRARDLGSKDGAGELGVGGWVTDGAV
jgi:hypothetical protein